VTAHAARLTDVSNRHRQRPRVLVLEDDDDFRSVLIELLEIEAFEVTVCNSYSELHDSVVEHGSVVVLADFWGSSHADLSPRERDEIRALARLAPTILLSGRAWTRSTPPGDLGLMSILCKPVAIEDLIDHIRRCLDVGHDRDW